MALSNETKNRRAVERFIGGQLPWSLQGVIDAVADAIRRHAVTTANEAQLDADRRYRSRLLDLRLELFTARNALDTVLQALSDDQQ